MKTVLTDFQIDNIAASVSAARASEQNLRFARAIEQAVLQSKQVQAWKRDAERYRKLSAMATQQADSLGPIFRIDVRRSAPHLFNFDAAIDAAMEQ